MRRGRLALATLLLVAGPAAYVLAADPAVDDPVVVRAQITPKRYTTLASEIPARVEHLTLREGDRFKQGDTLIGLDCALQRAQAAEARAVLAGADKTRAVDHRLVALGSGGVLEAAVADADAAKAEARLESATVVLSKCAITAPFPGRIVEQKVREHQYVQAGQALLDILDDSALEVEFIAPSRWLAWLKTGAAFQLQLDETGRTYPAKVTRLGARVDPVSHSVKVTGEIDGPAGDLIAGMSGRVLISPTN